MYAIVSVIFLGLLFGSLMADSFDTEFPVDPVVPRGMIIFTWLGVWQAVELIIYLYQHLTISVS
jgi:F0F1-type ATP synthase assembly protein I